MNASFVLLGLTMFAGAVLLARQFAAGRTSAAAGFALMALGGIGTVIVGLFPENTVNGLHVAGAALPFVLGNLGVVLIGASLADLPRRLRAFTLLAGATGLVALPLFLAHAYLGIGAGGMERVTAYPQDIWTSAVGAYLLSGARRPPVPAT